MVKTLSSNTGGMGLIPGLGTKIPTCLAAKKPKQNPYCNIINTAFNSGPCQEKKKSLKKIIIQKKKDHTENTPHHTHSTLTSSQSYHS